MGLVYVSLEERMEDVKSRYGQYPMEKYERSIELRKYFETETGGLRKCIIMHRP